MGNQKGGVTAAGMRTGAGTARHWRRRAALLCLSTALATGTLTAAIAQTANAVAPAQGNTQRRYDFSIPPQPLASAVAAFTRVTGLDVVGDGGIGRDIRSSGVSGAMTAQQALARLLAGTGLNYRFTNRSTVALQKQSTAGGAAAVAGAISLETIDVQEQGNTATTEGSNSYNARSVTVAGKMPVPLQEVPNSVSVITRQRLDDQNLNSAEDVLRQVTGVTAIPYGDGTSYFTARGYQLDAQYDGMPVTSGIQYQSQFDMSIYDRVEILRGPAGLLQGSGGPAGTANFVRRMPLDHYALTTDTQVGSWNFLRQTIDLSTPLNKEGTARGRFIITGQDRDFFYDQAKEWHGTLYGALQFDIDPQTTLSLSGVYQKQKFGPFDYGQSLYSNGSPLNAPRSAFFGADWSYNNYETTEGFANLKHTFDNGWVSNTTVLYRDMRSDSRYAYMDEGVNPTTNTVDYALQSGEYHQKWFGIDTNASGAFDFFGRESKFLLGVNYSYRTNHQFSGYTDAGVYDVSTAHAIIQDQYIPETYGQNSQTQEGGVYGQVRLKLLDPLTLVLGGRFSYYSNENQSLVPTVDNWISDPSVNGKFTPFAGLVYDLNKTYSVYVSYTDIFSPQANLTFAGGGLPPRVGEQYEVGIKGSYLNGRLSTTLAAFNINDDHRAVADPTNPLFYVSTGKARSRGIEAEVTGEILTGWSLTAGYTYLETKYLSDPDNAGLIFDPEEPKHTFKLWTKYAFREGQFDGLSLGAGVRAVSRVERSVGTGPADFYSQAPYAIVDGQIGYKFNSHYEGTFTVKNLFDKKYFDRLPTNYFGIYGEPRSFMASLKTHW